MDTTTQTQNNPQGGCPVTSSCSKHLTGIVWWTTLIVTVVAVPLVGVMVALAVTKQAFVQILIFMVTCWACTWLGMWLMKKANAHHAHWLQHHHPKN